MRTSTRDGVAPPDPATAKTRGRVHSPVEALLAHPRTPLAHLPTPLTPAPRLAAALGAPEILVKQDAETGFALGGNKVRKLEYELAPDRLRGVTCLITAGGPQSNHCRVTAAFAASRGLECVLVQNGPEPERHTGNALLHRLFGAEIRTVPDRTDREPGLHQAAAEVADRGGRALVVPLGASTGLGALGYARATLELVEQLDTLGPRPDRTLLFVPSSSCGTVAGIVIGLALLGRDDIVPVAVSADAPGGELSARAAAIAADGAALLGMDAPGVDRLVAVDDQVGGGYAVPTDDSTAALELFGRLEGIVLDPTYTAKGAAGLVEWVRERGAEAGERMVFLHTGGHPGLLA